MKLIPTGPTIYIFITLHFLFVIWTSIPAKRDIDINLNDRILPAYYVNAVKDFYRIKKLADDAYLSPMVELSNYVALYQKKWGLFAFTPANRFYNFKVYKGKLNNPMDVPLAHDLVYDSRNYRPIEERPHNGMLDWRFIYGYSKMGDLLYSETFPKERAAIYAKNFSKHFVNNFEALSQTPVDDYFLIVERQCFNPAFIKNSKACYAKVEHQWSKDE